MGRAPDSERTFGFLSLWVLIGGLLLAPVPSQASGAAPAGNLPLAPDLVAMLDLHSTGATAVEASVATDSLGEALFGTGLYRVITRDQLESRFRQRAGPPVDCTSADCAAEMGRVLGVSKIVTGRITKLDATHWVLSAALIDAESAQTLGMASVTYEGDFFGLLRSGAPQLAQRLSRPPPPAVLQAQPLPMKAEPRATFSVREQQNAMYPCFKANRDKYPIGLYAAGLLIWPSMFTTTSSEVSGRHKCEFGTGLTQQDFEDAEFVFMYRESILRDIAAGRGEALASYEAQMGCANAVREKANAALAEHLTELSRDETKPGDFIFDTKRIVRGTLDSKGACTRIGPEADT